MSEKTARFNARSWGLEVNRREALQMVDSERPILICGPTASGKSSLALDIATHRGGQIINGDALQVFSDWRILTARPSDTDLKAARHKLYGHVAGHERYSVGAWLRDVAKHLDGERPIIVGGTGLYFTALCYGLADIPPVPPEIRAEADRKVAEQGFETLLEQLDPDTAQNIDRQNPVRVQRAWEVLQATGEGLALWQSRTGPPLLDLKACQPFVMHAPPDWLNPRIAARFQQMLDQGLMDEARQNQPNWRANLPSAKAIGATELMEHLAGKLSQHDLATRVDTLTRQYAKRQRSWFRNRMKSWNWIQPD